MKKNIFLLLLIGFTVLVLTSCGTSTDTTEPITTSSPAPTTEAIESTESATTESAETTETGDEALPVFSADELAKFNGKEGNAAYVGYEGKVYDVSDIPAWKDGIHQGKYTAGQDLTDVLNNVAPHSSKFLTDKAPVVGTLE